MDSVIGLVIYFVWIVVVSLVHLWYITARCNYDSSIPYDPTQLDRCIAKSRRATHLCYAIIWSSLVVFLIWNYS